MIDFNRPLQTVGGREVRIYAKDGGGSYLIHGAFKDDDKGWIPCKWTTTGAFYATGPAHVYDLINVPDTRTVKKWMVVWENGCIVLHDGKIDAKAHAQSAVRPAFAIVPIEVTCTRGQGLGDG